MSAESLFQHLCKVVDSTEVDNSSKHYHLCKQLIIDGKINTLNKYSVLTFSQTTNFGLFQNKKVSRRQFQIC